jgi:hypothetical protein
LQLGHRTTRGLSEEGFGMWGYDECGGVWVPTEIVTVTSYSRTFLMSNTDCVGLNSG